MNARTNTSGLFRKASAIILTLALCTLGSTLAFADSNGSHTPTDYRASTPAGTSITNTASVSYKLGAVTTGATSNTVTVYVNQIDAFYIVANDANLTGQVPSLQVLVASSSVAATFNYSIVNISNGPITLTLGTKTPTLTYFTATASYKSTSSLYSFTATNGILKTGITTEAIASVGDTITIAQGTTASLTLSVTPPASTTAGGWNLFTLTLTDVTAPTDSALYGVTQYVSGSPLWTASTFGGLDTQVTAEVDVLAGVNFGKLQLLDINCAGTTFFTTVGAARTSASGGFPTSITWSAGKPITTTTGMATVSANPGECIAYRVVMNNPLSTFSIPTLAVISDTLADTTHVTFQNSSSTTPPQLMIDTTASTVPTFATPTVTGTTGAVIAPGKTAYLQYEVKVN